MSEKTVYTRPSAIIDGAVTGFCPGCLHSSALKTVLEVLDELGQAEKACGYRVLAAGA